MKFLFLKIMLAVTVLLAFTDKMQAQNNPYVDERLLHFGFFIGINAFDFYGMNTHKYEGQEYAVADAALKPGFSVGIITDFRLHNYWNLRINPTLQFAERELTYKHVADGSISRQTVLSVPICLPVYLKYSSERHGNIRPYLIGGGGASYDLARDEEKPIVLRPLDFYVELGVGCDIYFPFFKLAPELKLGLGFRDILTPLGERKSGFIAEEERKYTGMLSSLTSRMLTLTFNFE